MQLWSPAECFTLVEHRAVGTSFVLFDTALGVGGLAWGDQGVLGVQLPEPDRERVRGRLLRRFVGASEASPSAQVQDAIDRITALLRGEPRDLRDVTLDMERVPPFARQVYDVARAIPSGGVRSYGQIARQLGDPALAREVGVALSRNPFPIVVPCHRVIAAGGKLGGFSARGGVTTKQRLLALERANVAWQLPLLA
jgi:methylated-DNA-[protein]-cysteine S-methyltransferase